MLLHWSSCRRVFVYLGSFRMINRTVSAVCEPSPLRYLRVCIFQQTNKLRMRNVWAHFGKSLARMLLVRGAAAPKTFCAFFKPSFLLVNLRCASPVGVRVSRWTHRNAFFAASAFFLHFLQQILFMRYMCVLQISSFIIFATSCQNT